VSHIKKTDPPSQSIEEQPPPYTEVTSSPDNQKAPSVVESLPEYAALPARADKKPKTSSRSKKCCRWAIYSIFALACVVAGTVVGIVVTKAHRSKGDSSSNPDNTVNPPDVAHQIPKIAALAATECDAATIVVFQDNTGDVYLQGSLRNQTWNATESPSIPPSKILSNNDNGLKVETNLSVVCYGGTNTSYITPLVSLVAKARLTADIHTNISKTISVFYLNNISRSRGNGIWSSTFQVFYDTVSNPRPTRSLVLQSHHEVVKVGSQTSISAVSLAEEICLFYLWDWVPATLVEMRAPFTNNTVWTGPFSLNATAYDSSAALAASVNSMGETGIFFMDQDRQLAKYDWSGMGPGSFIPSHSSHLLHIEAI